MGVVQWKLMLQTSMMCCKVMDSRELLLEASLNLLICKEMGIVVKRIRGYEGLSTFSIEKKLLLRSEYF